MGSYLSFLLPPKDQKTIVMPFKNKQIEDIAKKFLLQPEDMIFFHQVFRNMDQLGNGYISEDNMFDFVQEEKTSVLSPYITKLFQLIEKENADRVCFVEWVPAICAFCLFTHEQIIKFVFGMIDDDHDEVISKKDIIKFLVKERYGEKVFPFNQVRAIELLDVDRADRIKFEQFKRIEQQIPFLCYPAFRLQQIFKEQIKGNTFWKKIFQQILQSEQEREKQKQQEIIDEQVNKKKNIEFSKKELNFQQQIQNKKIEQNIFKPNFLENTRISLQQRTYKFPRKSSVQRYLTQQNQESVMNARRMSDGMIDNVFVQPKQSKLIRDDNAYYQEDQKKIDLPTLEYSTLKRVNSSLYIKQPFTNNPIMYDKNDDQHQNSVFQPDSQFLNQGNQSIQPSSPKNQEFNMSRNQQDSVQYQYNQRQQQSQQQQQQQQQLQNGKQQIKKRVPRSLKNPQNVDNNPKKNITVQKQSNFLQIPIANTNHLQNQDQSSQQQDKNKINNQVEKQK